MARNEQNEQVDWGTILNQLNSASKWFRPKEGRTRLRLVLQKGDQPQQFYREVQSSFNGKVKSRFMVLALVLEGNGAKEEMTYTVTPVVLPKTVLKGLVSLLAEGYDLFSPDGHGVTLTRTGQGLDTDYSVMPSKNPVALPAEIIWPDEPFDQLAESFTQGSLSRDSEPTEGHPARKGGDRFLDEEEF